METEGKLEAKGRTRAGREYYYLFDYLRAVLALGVFFAHASSSLPQYLGIHFGDACVQIFFALSGFLIGGILLDSKKEDLPRFYFNRCTRIWIPYFLAIALLFVGSALRQDLHDLKLWEFFFYKVTFVYNFFGSSQLTRFHDRMPLAGSGNHFFSICVEEQFYLVAPFIILFAKRLRVPLLLGIVAVNVVWRGTVAFETISLGVLLAISRHRFGTWYLKPAGVAACVAVLAAAIVVMQLLGGEDAYRVMVGPAAAATVALLAKPGRPRPLGPTLGGMSYPFYLNHWVGLFLRNPLERIFHLPPLLSNTVALACSVGMSFAHYQFVDRKIHDLRARWYFPQRGVVAAVAAILLVVVGVSVGVAIRLKSA